MKRVWYNIFKKKRDKISKKNFTLCFNKREFNPEAERLNIND